MLIIVSSTLHLESS